MTCPGTPSASCVRSRAERAWSKVQSQEGGRSSRMRSVKLPRNQVFVLHTGKTTGTPPRMGLFPVRSAASLTHRFSVCPPLLFQLVTVAPKRYTSTLSPEGSDATTFWLPPSPTMSTCAEGPELWGAFRAEGRLARSTMVSYTGIGGSCVELVLRGRWLRGRSVRGEGFCSRRRC